MPLPTVVFNSAGSDTAASGYGPATAVSGTAAATVSGTAVVTLTVDGPDLSTIAAGDLFWVDSSSGRQFSIVVSVDNSAAKTVTVTDNYANTEGTKNWGCGGKRATWDNVDSRKLFTADVKAGWTITTETGQTITAAAIALVTVGDVASGYVAIRGSSGAIRLINTTFNGAIFSAAGTTAWYRFENLQFSCSAATKTSSSGISTTSTCRIEAADCVFGDATNTLNSGVRATAAGTYWLYNCEIKNTLSDGIFLSSAGLLHLDGCWIHGAAGTGKGVYLSSAAWIATLTIVNSLITGNAGDGIAIDSGSVSSSIKIIQNTIHGNGGDGIDLSAALSAAANAQIHSNNITGQTGGYGINAAAGADALKLLIDYNNFGTGGTANSSGTMNNITAGAHDLAVDPGYVNAGAFNFAAGTAIKAKGYPDATINLGANASTTLDFIDIGIQRQEAASGGGLLIHPGMAGGLRG